MDRPIRSWRTNWELWELSELWELWEKMISLELSHHPSDGWIQVHHNQKYQQSQPFPIGRAIPVNQPVSTETSKQV